MDANPGDLVVCVNAGCGGPNYVRTPELREKAIYTVAKVNRYGRFAGYELVEVRACGGYLDFDESRFRKLNDGNDDAELIERIKSCQPEKVSA